MNVINCKCGKAWTPYILLDGIPPKCRACKSDLIVNLPLYIRGEQDGGRFFFTFIFAALTIYGIVSGDKNSTEMILVGLALGGLCFLIGVLPFILRGGIRVEQDGIVIVSFTKKETKYLFDNIGVIRARALRMPGPGIGPVQYNRPSVKFSPCCNATG